MQDGVIKFIGQDMNAAWQAFNQVFRTQIDSTTREAEAAKTAITDAATKTANETPDYFAE